VAHSRRLSLDGLAMRELAHGPGILGELEFGFLLFREDLVIDSGRGQVHQQLYENRHDVNEKEEQE